MAIKSIPISDSTPAQRRAFVTTFLNLEVSDESSDDQVSAAIERAQPGVKLIFVEETEAPAVAPPKSEAEPIPDELLRPEEASGKAQGTLGKGDPRWTIVIPMIETEDGSGGHDVLVGVNGRAWQMKRGEELNVPQRVVEALDNAKQQILRHDEMGEEVRRSALRFPYSVVSRPPQAEIEAWRERVGQEFCA